MTKLIAGMQNSILVLESSKNGWKTQERLKGCEPQSIEIDPRNPERAYCGTFNDGLWKTDDGGQTWTNMNKQESFSTSKVMSVSVSAPAKSNDRFSTVYAGTEPTALYASNDGGESWEKLSALNELESASTWSFPPRPWTSHVRWIEPDINNPDYIFVAIEAGALVQSRDRGRTWIDRVEQGPYDTHTLSTHKKAAKRLYSAAGDGYFESLDYGKSWSSPSIGLKHNYLTGLAVDSGNPQTIIVSASSSAIQAHSVDNPNSQIYRRFADDQNWEAVSKGLPEPTGTVITILMSNPYSAGEFYALNNRGIFTSLDSGISWKLLDIKWHKEYVSQHPWSLAVGTD
jgi:photosystem II stability/assembly factor-like uncharacterized protein